MSATVTYAELVHHLRRRGFLVELRRYLVAEQHVFALNVTTGDRRASLVAAYIGPDPSNTARWDEVARGVYDRLHERGILA